MARGAKRRHEFKDAKEAKRQKIEEESIEEESASEEDEEESGSEESEEESGSEESEEEESGSEESEEESSSEESEEEESSSEDEESGEEAKFEEKSGEEAKLASRYGEIFRFGNFYFSKEHQEATRTCFSETWDFEEVVIEQILEFSVDRMYDIQFKNHGVKYIANRTQAQILKLFKSTGINISWTSKENFYDGGNSCWESTIFADGEFCEKIKKKYGDENLLQKLFGRCYNDDIYCNWYREQEDLELYQIDSVTSDEWQYSSLSVMPTKMPEIIFRVVRLADPMFDYAKKTPEELNIMQFLHGARMEPPDWQEFV